MFDAHPIQSPPVGVWGVGWVPRRFQAGYVRPRSGRASESTRLLSAGELRKMVLSTTNFKLVLRTPPVPHQELLAFRGRRRLLARAYNGLVNLRITTALLLRSGPFLQLTATRKSRT